MKYLIVLFSMTASLAAFSAPIFCKSTDGQFNITVANDWQSAELTKNGQTIEFGQLNCQSAFTAVVRREGSPLVRCNSANVADAGYTLYVFRPHGATDPVGTLSTESLIGTRKIADLNCVAAQN